MDNFYKTMTAAAQGMRAQNIRVRIAAENMANAKTPGYQRKQIEFREVIDSATQSSGVRVGSITRDLSDPVKLYEPSHPLADEKGYVTYSNVSMLVELADAREAQRSYEANLNLFNQSRRMYGRVLDLLRR
jgi:flagellar basal-body rod protein FlgC